MKRKSLITDSSASSGSNLTRRKFLKMGSVAVTGLSFSGNRFLVADTADRKIHIGVVGGNFGSKFYWHEHPDCIVEAVSDLRPERRDHLIKTYQCSKSYHSLEELVKDKKIDAVAVFTEGPNHVKHVLEVLKHGKHAICAVPACAGGGVEEAQTLLDAVKESGLTYMMAETSYYQDFTISVRKFYQQKKFGELYYVESEYLHSGLEVLFLKTVNRPGAMVFLQCYIPPTGLYRSWYYCP